MRTSSTDVAHRRRPGRTRTSCRPGSRRANGRARPRSVQLDRRRADPVHQVAVADELGRASKSIASSWPSSAFVDGVKIGAGSCSDSCSPGGSAMPADRAAGLVVLPARAGDVAAHDALDGQHLELAHDSARPRASSGTPSRWPTACGWPRLARLGEPVGRQARQDLALVGDRRGMNGVIRGIRSEATM